MEMAHRATRQNSANYSKRSGNGEASNKDEMEHLRIQLTDKMEKMESTLDTTNGELLLFRRKMLVVCLLLLALILGLLGFIIYLKLEGGNKGAPGKH